MIYDYDDDDDDGDDDYHRLMTSQKYFNEKIFT